MSLPELFFKRFQGLDRAHGTYSVKQKNVEKNKVEGKAVTHNKPPSIELWGRHLDGKLGLGIIPITDDATCLWGAIDIDVYDLDLLALEETISKHKLPLILCRTKSGGAHLYLFLSEAIEASIVRLKLAEWAAVLGYPDVEIFPKQVKLASKEDVGNWLNMPYFDVKKTLRYAYKKGVALSAEEFLAYASELQINEEQLKKISVFTIDELNEAPPCLQHLCQQGFPQGTRNNGLFNLGIFVKQKYGDNWKTKLDEYNQKYLNPPLSSKEVSAVINSIDKKAYFYRCNEQPIAQHCSKQICLKRKFGIGNSSEDLGVILNGLTKIGTTPPTWIVTVNGIRIEVEGTEALMSQTAFRNACVEKLHIIPNRIKQPAWEKVIKVALDQVETVEAPEDASPIGQFLHLIDEFCLTRAQGRSKEEILIGRPYKDETHTYFRSSDLLKYLTNHKFKEVDKSSKVWNILREHRNVETKVFRISGKSCRVWYIQSPIKPDDNIPIPDLKEPEEY